MSERIDDGHSTLISFANNPDVAFYEKEVTPPGIDGGDPNDTTTMRNQVWRTLAPRKLKTLTEAGALVSYDPVIYSETPSMINVNQLITITFPDGSSVDFWGYLRSITPGAIQEGVQPTAQIVVQPTNQDDEGAEVGPVYHAAA